MSLHPEKIAELKLEALREELDEPFTIWKEDNRSSLEQNFMEDFCSEGTPLDDDIPDFLDDHCDEFDEFARSEFLKQ